jgi:hypothetical protein
MSVLEFGMFIFPVLGTQKCTLPISTYVTSTGYKFNVGPETGQKLHLVFLHTSIVVSSSPGKKSDASSNMS